ncbi:hypothetical protein AMTR_s00073p00177110 [Amborella trichopoda]|uniref:Aminotransferase-like plant mobile domain-containing protein n=1 Tax=Amborella trichopoda TaxID=13333 RepID=W1NQV3_AMBTC|nr:hypothetical protein AMTR_s00073p00177110 [Amborella trichopoda]
MNQHDCVTLSTIIERSRSETNTGHFNVDIGEMMPTLEDTWKIFQLKVTGVAITVRRVENYEEHIVCMIGEVPPGRSNSFIQLTWLRNTFNQIPKNYNRTTLLRYTRAYLLYLVGRTIFADSTNRTVPTIYLQLFEDIDVVGQYAWGVAALAFLFRALSKVVHVDHQHLSGSTTILLCWAHEHFKLLCPIPKEIRSGQPRSLRWVPPREWYNTQNFNLVVRQELDNAQINDVIWTPYEVYLDIGEESADDRDYGLRVQVAGEEVSEELEQDDEMDDNVPIWHPSRPDEGPSNTQPIPTPIQPEEPRWQLRPVLQDGRSATHSSRAALIQSCIYHCGSRSCQHNESVNDVYIA